MARSWQPANAVEREMAEALAAGDTARYAAQLARGRLIVAEPPEPGTPAAEQVAAALPTGDRYVLVFTSREAMTELLGAAATGYDGLDLAAVLQHWPDSRHLLAVNPGTPVATVLAPEEAAGLASGRASLVPLAAVVDAVRAEVLDRIRRSCLRDLGAGADQAEGWRDAPAGSRLEADLRQAAARRDVHTFIDLLIPADVVIPAQVEVSDVDSLYDGTFPWLVTGDPSTWAIPMFSSAALLERVAATGTPRLQAGFLDAVANWPGEEYTLCLDPGAASELILTGEEVRDLAEAVISEAVAADG